MHWGLGAGAPSYLAVQWAEFLANSATCSVGSLKLQLRGSGERRDAAGQPPPGCDLQSTKVTRSPNGAPSPLPHAEGSELELQAT